MSVISALARKSLCHMVNGGRILRRQSSFKLAFVLCFALGFEAGLWMLFLDGFRFLDSLGGAGAMIAMRLFSLFFFGMGLMLILSSIVTSYATVFRSREIPFLIVSPFEIRQIVLYKFAESTALSSWAFFFIVIPFVGAYAWHRHVSALFVLWTFLFSAPFLVLCSGIGALLMILVARWLPSARVARAGLTVLGLAMASNALVPSWWVSEGILSLAREQWLRGIMLWGTVTSTAVVIVMLMESIGSRVFYEGWQRATGSAGQETHSRVLFRRLENALVPWLPPDVRALIFKDLRTFLRDPMQWSQVLIFFGLLALYYANLRSFHYHLLPETWRNTVAFLNVFSVAAVMCSLGSRFIYPQLSLEGQGFWIIGMAPTSMTRVLVTKFALPLAGLLIVSVLLMLLSSSMLCASPLTKLVAVALAGSLSFAVCGLSTGLGAVFMNLEQRNPAAIVSGFGGTLNLVLSLGFMLIVILPFGFVFHLHNTGRIADAQLNSGLVIAGAWMVIVTLLATWIPLWAGARSLRHREF